MSRVVLDAPDAARLYVESDMAGADLFGVAGGTAVVHSSCSPAKHPPNEDAAALIPCNPTSAVLVVADGLGGAHAGEAAARAVVESLRGAVRRSAREGELLRTAIIGAIESANAAILAMGVGAGTTVSVAVIEGERVQPYHVGDSVILVVGQRGRLKHQTVAHSPVGMAVEAGILSEQEAMHHEHRHIVSNVVGSDQMRIEVGPVMSLAPRDTLLLATDGLADNLHPGEIIERVRKGPLERAGQRLITDSRRRMETPGDGEPCKPDDMTFVVFRPGAARA